MAPPEAPLVQAVLKSLLFVNKLSPKVIEAEAQIPIAMAEALRSGNLGVMDYYKMQNIQADTDMRDSIARPTGNSGGGKTDKK